MFWFGASIFAVGMAWMSIDLQSTKKEDRFMKYAMMGSTILIIILYLIYTWQAACYVPYKMNPTVTPLR